MSGWYSCLFCFVIGCHLLDTSHHILSTLLGLLFMWYFWPVCVGFHQSTDVSLVWFVYIISMFNLNWLHSVGRMLFYRKKWMVLAGFSPILSPKNCVVFVLFFWIFWLLFFVWLIPYFLLHSQDLVVFVFSMLCYYSRILIVFLVGHTTPTEVLQSSKGPLISFDLTSFLAASCHIWEVN